MIDRGFVARLSCPYCRAALVPALHLAGRDGDIRHGSVACGCYEYPIVDGILVLRQLSGPADNTDPAVAHLRADDVGAARRSLEAAASMVDSPAPPRASFDVATARRLASSARRRLGRWRQGSDRPEAMPSTAAPLRVTLARTRPPAFGAYLYQRYANPSFLASIPMMALLETVESHHSGSDRPTVLDLGCGIGHSTAMMRALFPTMSFVAADPDFVNLQILREHFVEDAIGVCLDAELPLPFADDQFDAVFCLDAFHYIRSKWALSHELDRCVEESGIWILPHLHNASVPNVSPGIPLRPEDYLRMFDFASGTVLDESIVLDRFMSDTSLDLSRITDVPALAAVPDLDMYATRRSDIGGTYQVGDRLLAAGRTSGLGINPIYSIETAPDAVRLRMAWPDPELERECAAACRYLPAEVEIDPDLLARLCVAELEPGDDSTIAALVRSLVLLPLPPGYHDIATSIAASVAASDR